MIPITRAQNATAKARYNSMRQTGTSGVIESNAPIKLQPGLGVGSKVNGKAYPRATVLTQVRNV